MMGVAMPLTASQSMLPLMYSQLRPSAVSMCLTGGAIEEDDVTVGTVIFALLLALTVVLPTPGATSGVRGTEEGTGVRCAAVPVCTTPGLPEPLFARACRFSPNEKTKPLDVAIVTFFRSWKIFPNFVRVRPVTTIYTNIYI